MSKRKKYIPKHTSVPMLVNRAIHEKVETLSENALIIAFKFGVATKENFDYLSMMANVLNVAGQRTKDKSLQNVVTKINELATSIKARYDKTGKFGVSGLELKDLTSVVNFYDSYWKRRTTTLYNECVHEILAFYDEIKRERAAA